MKAYGYARVSTDEQEQSSENQIQRLSAYISSLGLECGGVFADEAVSASKNPMETRKEGKKLWDLLQPGDMVVITHPDRAFRSQQDSHNTLALSGYAHAQVHPPLAPCGPVAIASLQQPAP